MTESPNTTPPSEAPPAQAAAVAGSSQSGFKGIQEADETYRSSTMNRASATAR